ncbi:ribonuclease Z [Candidatus Woesearchaeota archaeon]|nr:ribonuclease Z [Candidatus Woesearchaeota archaeon]
MELTFLGTSCMVPTKERNVSGIYLKFKGEGILLDCGEGTQRQMNIAGIKRTSVNKILISHWHGDHVSGIIGLLQTMGNEIASQGNEAPHIKIFGPKETKKRVEHMMQTCIFDNKIDIEVHELNPGRGEVVRFFETPEYALECARLNHGIPCVGYSFIEKERLNIDVAKQKKLGVKDGPWLRKIKDGKDIEYKGKKISAADMTYLVPQKKLTYIADTEACEEAVELAREADVMISESAFASSLQEKAEMRKHMSARDAAFMAEQAGVNELLLTHFSQRYKTVEELEEEAKIHFKNVRAAFDFMKVKL